MEVSDSEAQRILRASNRHASARAILDKPATRRGWVYAASCALTAVAVSYVLRFAGQEGADALLVGLTTGLVVTGIEQWRLRCRLEAAIELLKLGDVIRRSPAERDA